jgi:hypothetical protein
MPHVHYAFPLQGMRFRVAYKGVLGLGLPMVSVDYEFVTQGMQFNVCLKRILEVSMGLPRTHCEHDQHPRYISFATGKFRSLHLHLVDTGRRSRSDFAHIATMLHHFQS